MQRRTFLVTLSGLLGTFIPIKLKSKERRIPVLPPGAINCKSFNLSCNSCHLCISRCPSKILMPAKNEFGLQSIGQPFLDFEKGYCGYDCVECISVCPTGALRKIETITEKQQIQIGLAVYKSTLCHINNKGISCGICVRNCPTGAITMKKNTNNLLVPFINISKCIGCGACQYYCPTSTDSKAIYVNGLEVHRKII